MKSITALDQILRPKETGGNSYEPVEKYLDGGVKKGCRLVRKTLVNKLGKKRVIFVKQNEEL